MSVQGSAHHAAASYTWPFVWSDCVPSAQCPLLSIFNPPFRFGDAIDPGQFLPCWISTLCSMSNIFLLKSLLKRLLVVRDLTTVSIVHLVGKNLLGNRPVIWSLSTLSFFFFFLNSLKLWLLVMGNVGKSVRPHHPCLWRVAHWRGMKGPWEC